MRCKHVILTGCTTTYGTIYGYDRLSPEGAALLDNDAIRTNSFFGPFSNELMYENSAGSVLANNYEIRAELLTHCIPSESFAVGANPVPAWGDEGDFKNVKVRNYDMGTLKDGVNDLPKDERKWVHSCFINRSFKRTSKLYKSIARKIKDSQRRK